MKRFLLITLSLILLIFSCSCNENTPQKESETTKVSQHEGKTAEQILSSYCKSFAYDEKVFSYAVIPYDSCDDSAKLLADLEAEALKKTDKEAIALSLYNTDTNESQFKFLSLAQKPTAVYETTLQDLKGSEITEQDLMEALKIGYVRSEKEETIFYETFYSSVLQKETDYIVILPDAGKIKDLPVMWLYHGMYQNEKDYLTYTDVYDLAQEYHVAVVLPNCSDSFCLDKSLGDYYTFLTTELLEVVRDHYPISSLACDNCVAGISMGGYGAWLLELRRPDLFSACASLSGCLDIAYMLKMCTWTESAAKAFGSDFRTGVKNTDRDLFLLLDEFTDVRYQDTRFYACCGNKDSEPLTCSRNMKQYMYKEADWLDFTYEETVGAHDWTYWKSALPDVFKWLYGAEE